MVFGSSCYWAWVLLDRSGIVPYGSSDSLAGQQVLTGTMAIAGLAVFLISGLLYHGKARRTLAAIVALLAVFGVVGTYHTGSSSWVSTVSPLALCCVRAGLMQLWSLWMITLPEKRAVKTILATASFSTVLFLVVAALPLEAALVVFPCLPICAAVLAGLQRLKSEVLRREPNSTEKGSSFYGFLSRQFLIGFLVGLLGVLGAIASVSLSSWHRALALCCAAVLAVLAAVFWRKNLPRHTVFTMPVLLAVFFVFPFGVDEATLPKISFILCWLYGGYISIFHILGYAPRTPLPLLRLTLLAQATCAVGTFAGSCFGLLRDWAGEWIKAPASIHSGLALVAMLATLSILLILLQRRTVEADAYASSGEISLARVCDDMTTCYGLTSRERDILELLGKGYSRPHIGRELYLSESTVKTHAGNLYRKLGIHKHDELLELIAAWPSGD